MCGRIFIRPSASSQIVLDSFDLKDVELPRLNNVAPTGLIPVIHHDGEGVTIRNMRWWLHPFWEKVPPHQKQARFNARVETVLTLNSYRSAIKKQRGIVPIDAFVEWQTVEKEKLPWYIEGDGAPLAIAAIWDVWNEEVYSCAIITQPATEAFAPLHDRMPISFTPDQAKDWVNPENNPADLLDAFGHASVPLRERRISKEVNNAKNKADPVFL